MEQTQCCRGGNFQNIGGKGKWPTEGQQKLMGFTEGN